MTPNLTANLVERLEAIRGACMDAGNESERNRMILGVCEELCREYAPAVAANLTKIVHHYITREKIEIDGLIAFLKVNREVDHLTVIREEADDFDGKFGTTTSPILTQYELPEEISLERFRTSGRYHPSPVSSVKMALDALEKYNVQYSSCTFIDVGSGLGRNLLLAAAYPFRKIVGIEHSAYLHETAGKNIGAYRSAALQCNVFDLQCIDALEYEFPAGDLVLYFWRPFTDEIAERFMDKLDRYAANASCRIILIFLGVVYPAVQTSRYFGIEDKFFTPDLFFSEEEYFTITIYSNQEQVRPGKL
ncbi:class I SAM-dependent methyltransferase [Chitinophaga japonensis]|uniref:Methyltransferase family protein n=1 Tax=Chitinophaga japonensis TaxID=104662 RepID=A0A562STJ5_CHIJA|nr:class I SAM-dependent methyltransferase [Chitinophaga japonensis]TWI84565.1 hypothetical protein LX66_4935 [Chitinophaga japonensis]